MIPSLVVADAEGNIHEEPELLMLINRCGQWSVPDEAELIPLPPESDLFMLPGRNAVGFDPRTGEAVATDSLAVAAFPAPGHTISAHPAYAQAPEAPILPLFAYGAAGYANGRFWIAAQKVDEDVRQQFRGIKDSRLRREANTLLKKYPRNRLVRHILENCASRYRCPAARNFVLGRYEAPLPSSRACNAECVGCISGQRKDSPIVTTPQCRLAFTPKPSEIAEVMRIHEKREKNTPIYSFGQGCEGDPLCNAALLYDSIAMFREGGGEGTINCNCNASRPQAIADLARAGLTSLRASLHSARAHIYNAYHRPVGYELSHVVESLCMARAAGVHTSLNLLYFPGLTDTWSELDALSQLLVQCGVSMIQLRNLNIDPVWYARHMGIEESATTFEPAMGLSRFMKELKKLCPWIYFGYFNPYLGTKADIAAPMPA